MTIASDLQSLTPGALVELFELDLSGIGGPATPYRFYSGTNELRANIVWAGNTYTAIPIEASGFEKSGKGTIARPKLRVANIGGLLTALIRDYQDMVGAKLTRKRTFVKYLDAVNFAGGTNPTADPNSHLTDEVYFVDRKTGENPIFVTFDLAPAWDLSNVKLPGRLFVRNVCQWRYRSAECSYSGGAVATINDVATAVLAEDQCGKRLASCKLRFGTFAELPYGGFPGVGLIK